jgi:hypothetical protein
MARAAVSAGYAASPGWNRTYLKSQIRPLLTSDADLRAGKQIELPPAHGTFNQARRVEQATDTQLDFD